MYRSLYSCRGSKILINCIQLKLCCSIYMSPLLDPEYFGSTNYKNPWILFSLGIVLTLTLLSWRIWWVPNNASKWQMRFNSAFRGLKGSNLLGLFTMFFKTSIYIFLFFPKLLGIKPYKAVLHFSYDFTNCSLLKSNINNYSYLSIVQAVYGFHQASYWRANGGFLLGG